MALQLSSVYTIVGPDGTTAVLNDPTHTDFVGYLVELSGPEGAEVRENASTIVEGDGGRHDRFLLGRKPTSIEVLIPEGTAAMRNARIDKLDLATEALDGDSVMRWTEDGSAWERALWLRRAQPFRITGTRGKRAQLQMVSARPRVLSYAEQTLADAAAPLSLAVTNDGTKKTHPRIRVTGAAGTTLVVTNTTTGKVIQFKAGAVPAGAHVDIYTDPLGYLGSSTIVTRDVRDAAAARKYSALDFAATNWIELVPGANTITASHGTALDVWWRHAGG